MRLFVWAPPLLRRVNVLRPSGMASFETKPFGQHAEEVAHFRPNRFSRCGASRLAGNGTRLPQAVDKLLLLHTRARKRLYARLVELFSDAWSPNSWANWA